MDFPVTRRIIAALPAWVDELASPLPKPIKVPIKGSFRWRHPVETAEVVEVAKAVRMSSGIAAALNLADAGWTVECATLLRSVSDFAAEVIFLAEGLLQREMNAPQEKFVSDYFRPLPSTPDELAAREREYYIGRRDIQKAHRRLAEKADLSADELGKLLAFLNKGYDSYVHGGYETAMELFTGRGMRFMMAGHESARHRCVAKTCVAGKLYEVLAALELMALTRRLAPLLEKIRQARWDLDASDEQSAERCPAD